MQIDALQRMLESRFEQLSGERIADRRIFALEHDVSIDMDALATELSKQLRYGRPDARYWLVWVVFATEIGYSYAGAEYWQTFGDRLPAWRQYADNNRNRSQIRVWFRKFALKYHGVRPTGTWAQQFSIIAWPITHAVLPQDLQQHFAKVLHVHRYRLAADNDPVSIGRVIHTHSSLTSSRFREFSEQEELVGRIALALLGVESDELPLSPATTKRIADDLERTQAAKDFLREARDVRRIVGVSGKPKAEHRAQHSSSPRFNLTPTLILSREHEAWRVAVSVPSLAPLAAELAEVRSFLRSTKVQFQCGAGTWQPAGVLTRSTKLHMLQQWPEDGVVLKFKDSCSTLERLLSQDGLLSKGPTWVCKIGADGLARQVRKNLVRAGSRYIILASSRRSFPHSSVLRPIDVNCAGMVGVELDLPTHLTSDIRNLLSTLGLRLTTTVRVWPAGIPATSWDGDGHSEWLTTDEPCFGIEVDHDVDAVEVMLNGATPLTISRSGIKGPSWLQLSRLPSGQHRLIVEVKSSARDQEVRSEARGEVLLEVRDPLGIEETINQRGGLMAIPSPIDATIDDLEQGRLKLDLFGPRAREIKVRLEMPGSEGIDVGIGRFELPATICDVYAKLKSEAKELLGVSSTSLLIVDAEELGSFVLPLERVSRAVRWLPSRSKQSFSLRLIDEAGLGEHAVCQMAPLSAPNVPESLDYESCLSGIEVKPPGGLYVVTGKGRMDAVLVSMPAQQRLSGFASLKDFETKLEGFALTPSSLKGDAQLLTLWSKARAVGSLGSVRQKKMLRAMGEALVRLVCGAAWSQAEASFERSLRDDKAIADLGDRTTASLAHRSFAAKLRISHKDIVNKSPAEVVAWLLPIASAFGVCSEARTIEMALRYCTDPAGFAAQSRDIVGEVSELVAHGDLVRGIRYLQILQEGKVWDWS